MSYVLGASAKLRIQRLVDSGRFRDAAAVIDSGLDLLDSQETQEEWLLRNKEVITERLEESYAQAQRGELYSEDEALRILDQRMAERVVAQAGKHSATDAA